MAYVLSLSSGLITDGPPDFRIFCAMEKASFILVQVRITLALFLVLNLTFSLKAQEAYVPGIAQTGEYYMKLHRKIGGGSGQRDILATQRHPYSGPFDFVECGC